MLLKLFNQPSGLKKKKGAYQNRGFTLLEIMVSLSMGLLLVATLVSVFQVTARNMAGETRTLELQENIQAAVLLITHHVERAGYMGLYSEAGSQKMEVGGNVVPISSIVDPHDCTTDNDTWIRNINIPLIGLNNQSPDSKFNCYSNFLTGAPSDLITVRYYGINTTQDPTALFLNNNFENKKYYFARSALSETEIYNDLENPPALNGSVVVTDHPLEAHSFYVGAGSNTCGQDGKIPTLYHVSINDNGSITTNETIPGIEKIEFEYLIANGADFEFVDANDAQLTSSLKSWRNVQAVKFWIVARTVCPDKTLAFNDIFALPSGDYITGDNHYQRTLFTGVIHLKNMNN